MDVLTCGNLEPYSDLLARQDLISSASGLSTTLMPIIKNTPTDFCKDQSG
jgi:hypothetical protein